MSELLMMEWNENNQNEALRCSAVDLLNGNYKGDDYLLCLIDKIYNWEILNKLKKPLLYRNILIDTFCYKISNNDLKNARTILTNINVDKLPLVSTCLLFALERESFQIKYKNTEQEKKEFYDEINALFVICKNAIKRYHLDVHWINDCDQASNNYNNYEPYLSIRYDIITFRINLMCIYKKFDDIESEYLSILSTGRTWKENQDFLMM